MTKVRFWGPILSIAALTGMWSACSDRFGANDCKATRTCAAPVGGVAGDATEPNSAGEKGLGGESAASGSDQGGTLTAGEGGATSSGPDGETAGGEAGAPAVIPIDSPFVGCDGVPFLGNPDVLRTCILRVGCRPWAYPDDTISHCLSENTQLAHKAQNCTLNAKTCDDVELCLGEQSAAEYCSEKPDGSYCDGTLIIGCSTYDAAFDCSKHGGTCKIFDVPQVPIACVIPGLSCVGTDLTQRCGGANNAYSYQCRDSFAYGEKCSAMGMVCRDGRCVDPDACDELTVSCNGEVAQVCNGKGEAEHDCASVGLHCSTTGNYVEDGARHCLAPACTREDLASCKEHCDGANLTVCYGGSPVTVDCRDYGFRTCAEYDYSCSNQASGDCVDLAGVITYAQCE